MSSEAPQGGLDERLSPRVIALCERFRPVFPPGPARDALDEVASGLAEPLRVAVTGRVNAGKSTLVNALLGQQVAPTDVSECTRHVTWYRYGVPERLEVVLRAGTSLRLPLQGDGSLPPDTGADPSSVRHLEVYLANDVLRDLVVIDTPGLASGTGSSGDTTELLALDITSRLAVSKADAMLFVLTSERAGLQEEALEAFASMTSGLSPTALNAVGVLTRADQLESDDPLEAARAQARTLASTLRGSLGAVVALVGLLAETARCGLLSESSYATVAELARLDDRDVQRLLVSTDRFLGGDAGSRSQREVLLERLDLWGVAQAVAAVRAGAASASALITELEQKSGLESLLALLQRSFGANREALKAASAAAALERLAYSGMAAGPVRLQLLDALEELMLDPAMHRLAELNAWLECRRGTVALPDALLDEVARATSAGEARERLGLAHEADASAATAAAKDGIVRWKVVANDAATDSRSRSVAETMVRTYERMWIESSDPS